MSYKNLFSKKKVIEPKIKSISKTEEDSVLKEDLKPVKSKKESTFLNLFKMGANIPKKTGIRIEIFGIFMFFFTWFIVTMPVTKYNEILKENEVSGLVFSPTIMPSPLSVFKAYEPLIFERDLISHTWKSIKLNVAGYMLAILITIPIGFLVSLFGFFDKLISPMINVIRFVPLTAVTVLFVAWFGLYFEMKALFLSFGIIVYLLPVVVVRVKETLPVHIDTVWSLGATNWQLFKHVYFPAAMSKIFEDIKVITAISWTYIVVAEIINKGDGGLATLIDTAKRGARLDIQFAVLFVIMLFGFLQDKLFDGLDKKIFKFKHAVKSER